MKNYLKICPYIFIILTNSLFAQSVSFDATVDKSIVAVGDRFQVTFTLNGATGGKNFRPPSFNDFIILGGPNQSTSMQFINGAMSASISYTYILQAQSEGKYTIQPAAIEYGGKQLKTKPITIEVTKGQTQHKQRTEKEDDSDIGKQIGENLFLKVSIDKSRVYQGEQITATYKIYTRVGIVNYNITKIPSLIGFWAEDIEIPQQIQLANEVIDGKQYRVGILKKTALFPQRSGTLTIDPMEVDCVVQVQLRRRSYDFFDQFFSDPFFGNVTNVNHKIRNEPVKITVLPLPTENAPPDFSGAVGKFSMEAWLDKTQVKTNDAVTLKVKISGTGNIKLIEAPTISILPDIESFEPKISDKIIRENNLIAGSRTFDYLLIPRRAGKYRIAPINFSFFDIAKKNFVSLISPEFILEVVKGTDIALPIPSGISKEEIKLLTEDIRFIKSGNIIFKHRDEHFTGSPLFFILTISPMITFTLFFLYVKHRKRALSDVRYVRNRKAQKIARRRLSAAKAFLQKKNSENFYTEISKALWGYFSDKLGIPPVDLSIENVCNSLTHLGLTEELTKKISTTIEMCEFARFSPSPDSVQMEQTYENATSIISSIEAHLR